MKSSLLQRALEPANLRLAWEQVAANKGAAGADDVTIRRFARNWEAHVLELRESVLAHTYRPKRLRRFHLAKADGGWRTLSVPAVGDRVLQRAVLNVLEPRWERLFLDCSYAYRPRRSLKDAARRIAAFREAGYRWVLDGDIVSFFENVDHELLGQFLAESLSDQAVIELVGLWLKSTRLSELRPTGLPLGAVISPILSNLYLHTFDMALARANLALTRYADDFIIQCETRAEVEETRNFVAWGLRHLKLRLHEGKTRIVHFDEGFEFLGIHFQGNRLSYVAHDKHVSLQGWPLHFRWPPLAPAGYGL